MPDRYEELERLQRLRESGALTDEEFGAEKQRLLGGLPQAAQTEPAEAKGRRWLLVSLAGFGVVIAIVAGIVLGRSAGPGSRQEETRSETAPLNDMSDVLNAGAPTEDIRTLPEEEQTKRAFQAAFGAADRASVSIDSGGSNGTDHFEETVEFKPGGLVWTTFGPVLISIGEVKDAAHVSAGKIAVHYLRPVGGQFEVAQSFVPAIETGTFGQIGSWTLSRKFSEFPLVYATGGGTWQGYTCSVATLTELTPNGPRQLADIPIAYSNGGAVQEGEKVTEIRGNVRNIVKDQSFDVIYSGSQTFTDHYVRSGGGYALEGGESRMPSC